MTQDQITALEEAAKKATPGPWQQGWLGDQLGCRHVVDLGLPPKAPFVAFNEGSNGSGAAIAWPASAIVYSDDGSSGTNATFIALANPSAILSLISTIRDLERERDEARHKVADAYQVVGSLSHYGGLEGDEIVRALDYFSDEDGSPRDDFLPWPRAPLTVAEKPEDAPAFKAGMVRAVEKATLSTAAILLMAGEMKAGEMRAVKAVLGGIVAAIIAEAKGSGG